MLKMPSDEAEKAIKYIEYAVDAPVTDTEAVFRHWGLAKDEYLFKLFNNELILKKEIDYEVPSKHLACLIERDKNFIFADFRSQFYDILSSKPCLVNQRYELLELLNSRYLAENRYGGRAITIIFPDGKEFKITNGMRPLKAIAKIIEYFPADKFEKFRLYHSQILNTRKMRGNLCLSIHPLDYITMSDNDSNWSSCMSWINYGDYRNGTIEMMNSNCVVVAYLENKIPMNLIYKDETMQWNNKRWRELFIVSPEIITEIKGYPYQSNILTTYCLDWLKELAEKNCGFIYDNKISKHYGVERSEIATNEDGKYIVVDFSTNAMFNDFNKKHNIEGKSEAHLCYFSKDMRLYQELVTNHSYKLQKNYSGKLTCIRCGKEFTSPEDGIRIQCFDCEEQVRCGHCGENLYFGKSDMILADGKYYCRHCADKFLKMDGLTGQYHLKEYMKIAYVCDYDENDKIVLSDDYFYLSNHNRQHIMEAFVQDGWDSVIIEPHFYAIPRNKLTPLGLEFARTT